MFRINCFGRNLKILLVAAMLMAFVGRQAVCLMARANPSYPGLQDSNNRTSHQPFERTLRGFNCLTQEGIKKNLDFNSGVCWSPRFLEIVLFTGITAFKADSIFGKLNVFSAGPIPLRI